MYPFTLNNTLLSFPGIPVIVPSKCSTTAPSKSSTQFDVIACYDLWLWWKCVSNYITPSLLSQIQFQLEGVLPSPAHHLLLSSFTEFNLLMFWVPKAHHLILKSRLLGEHLGVFSALFRFGHCGFKLLLWALLKQF